MSMNRESLRKHCEKMCKMYESAPSSNAYMEHKLVLDLLDQTEWIPVTKRLPNEFADVLCNTDSEEIFIATYLGKMNDGTDCFDDNDGMMWEGNVIAWMPLPISYQCK